MFRNERRKKRRREEKFFSRDKRYFLFLVFDNSFPHFIWIRRKKKEERRRKNTNISSIGLNFLFSEKQWEIKWKNHPSIKISSINWWKKQDSNVRWSLPGGKTRPSWDFHRFLFSFSENNFYWRVHRVKWVEKIFINFIELYVSNRMKKSKKSPISFLRHSIGTPMEKSILRNFSVSWSFRFVRNELFLCLFFLVEHFDLVQVVMR